MYTSFLRNSSSTFEISSFNLRICSEFSINCPALFPSWSCDLRFSSEVLCCSWTSLNSTRCLREVASISVRKSGRGERLQRCRRVKLWGNFVENYRKVRIASRWSVWMSFLSPPEFSLNFPSEFSPVREISLGSFFLFRDFLFRIFRQKRESLQVRKQARKDAIQLREKRLWRPLRAPELWYCRLLTDWAVKNVNLTPRDTWRFCEKILWKNDDKPVGWFLWHFRPLPKLLF